MSDTFELFDTITAGGELLLVLIMICIVYVFCIAPALVLTGKADGARDYAAGAVGMLFWALVAVSFAGGL